MNRRKIKIFLDFGHGGSDSGAVSGSLIEKIMNLVTGLECKRVLELYDIEVMASRNIDKTVSLAERVRMANEWGADYFISIHYNAGGGDRGEVIHSIHRGNGVALATSIANRMKALGQDAMKIYEKRGEDNKDYYYVIKYTNMDAVIVEGGFIDNPIDRQLFDTEVEQQMMGATIAYGILDYLGIAIKEVEAVPKRYFVRTGDFLASNGLDVNSLRNKYFYDIERLYVNPRGNYIYIETQYLSKEKCNEIVKRLGNDTLYASVIEE